LVAICVPLLFGLWWWSARRARQAPGQAELRDNAPPPDQPRDALYAAGDDVTTTTTADVEPARAFGGAQEWSVSPFEPLRIRTADFDAAEFDDLPMSAQPPAVSTPVTPPPPPAPAPAPAPAPTAAVPTPADTGTSQRIVGVRVCALGDAGWSGAALRSTLEDQGLAFGRYQVFHRRHSDGRSLFSAASLVEPGIFDPSRMVEEYFRGLTLFAILPGPAPPLQTFDAMMETAKDLAEALGGTVQDDRGSPLSPQRVMALREDVARFQARLSVD
jgi:cell division protein ZipA